MTLDLPPPDHEIKIIENFLDKNFFNDLQTLIVKSEFAWFKRDHMTSPKDLGFFTHSFYNDHRINTDNYFKYIIPILKILNSSAVVEVKANMLVSPFYQHSSDDKWSSDGFHTDYPFNCKTAILYLNDFDGGTEFKMGEEIKFVEAKANKIVVFDTRIPHRGKPSKIDTFKYLINFNYFES